MFVSIFIFVKCFVHIGCLSFYSHSELQRYFTNNVIKNQYKTSMQYYNDNVNLKHNYIVLGSIIATMVFKTFNNYPQQTNDIYSLLNYCRIYENKLYQRYKSNLIGKTFTNYYERYSLLKKKKLDKEIAEDDEFISHKAMKPFHDLRFHLTKKDQAYRNLIPESNLYGFFSMNSLAIEHMKYTYLNIVDELVTVILKGIDIRITKSGEWVGKEKDVRSAEDMLRNDKIKNLENNKKLKKVTVLMDKERVDKNKELIDKFNKILGVIDKDSKDRKKDKK